MDVILVLTLGRSGSSLIMQTLDLLGCEVIGRKFDSHDDPELDRRHRELNAGGYFEEPDIYYGGAASARFQALVRDTRSTGAGGTPRACKMDVRHFSDPAQGDAWAQATPAISAVVVSFREPVEQARSEFHASLMPGEVESSRDMFVFLTAFMARYAQGYGAIAAPPSRLNRELLGKVHLVDHSESCDPSSFVERLRRIAGLPSDPQSIARAIANISPDRVRTKSEALGPEERQWAEKLGASEVHRKLLNMRDLN